jgi:curli biogenesis system outer membrane secretion channel CsgG
MLARLRRIADWVLVLGLLAALIAPAHGADAPKKTKKRTDTYDGNANLGLPEYKGVKHAVGCKDFSNEAGYRGEWDLGQNLTVMLESALFDTGRFVLVERENLGTVMDEQDLQASGRAAKAKDVAQTGKLRSAKYIATGALTEIESSESGIGGGLALGPVSVGGSHKKAQVTIIAKLVDTTSGEIVAKQRIVGKSGSTALGIGGSHKGYGGTLGGFVKTPIGEACQDCINQAAVFFAKQMETYPAEGAVVAVANGRIIINRGSEYAFRTGMTLNVATEGETLTDPETGAVLDKSPGQQLGVIRVTDVKEKVSYCEVVSGEANPPRGATVTVASLPESAPEPAAAKTP